jgi:hypothetical protein
MLRSCSQELDEILEAWTAQNARVRADYRFRKREVSDKRARDKLQDEEDIKLQDVANAIKTRLVRLAASLEGDTARCHPPTLRDIDASADAILLRSRLGVALESIGASALVIEAWRARSSSPSILHSRP